MNRAKTHLQIIFQILCFSLFILASFTSAFAAVKESDLWSEGVSRKLARVRSENIEDVRYRLIFEITPGAEKLKGSAEISFKLKNVLPKLVLDFRDLDENGKIVNGKIGTVRVNENAAGNFRQINGHLVIAGKNLRVGANRVSLEFESDIVAANRPLVRFVDSADGAEYVYSLFTPSDASLAFPCFDQPNLKGRFSLEIIAPESWKAISNAEAVESKKIGEDLRRTVFGETKPLSTYLFAFAAGDFREIKNENSSVSSSLFVRRTQFENAKKEADELFRVTNDGMRRMIDYFDREFPFPKNDFVLLPGFAFRAMEHAGATFFREDALLFRRQPTRIDRLNRSVLILHELSHQWFGNLVTMRWFDDLWLKEGFANYIAFVALAAAESEQPEFVWKRFYQNFKPDALEVDITGGTTPLRQNLANLKDAKTAYGAIVYTKAPTVLRNLEFVLGVEDFRGGVRMFLKRHAYGNADWTDFVRAFEESSGKSLRRWAIDYIVRRSTTFVKPSWSCDARNKISDLTVSQTDALGGVGAPRAIKAQILLAYDDAPPKIISYDLQTKRKTIREAAGEKCPAYVFANHGDRGYAYFLLDDKSRKAIATGVSDVADPFLRSMLWGALWEAVRAAEMPPLDFVRVALRALPGEQDEDLARNLLEYAARAYQRYLTVAQQKTVIAEFENLCRREMSREAVEIGKRINYWRTFYSIAETPDAGAFLKKLLSGETKIPGIELRAADRWRIVARLLANRDEQAEQILSVEKSRNSGDDARKQAYVVEAARTDAETKRRYFEQYLRPTSVPEDWAQESLANFNSPNQSNLTLPYLKLALAQLPKIQKTRKIFFTTAWLRAFIGGQQTSAALAVVRQFLASARLEENLKLKILEISDDLERAVILRRKFGSE